MLVIVHSTDDNVYYDLPSVRRLAVLRDQSPVFHQKCQASCPPVFVGSLERESSYFREGSAEVGRPSHVTRKESARPHVICLSKTVARSLTSRCIY